MNLMFTAGTTALVMLLGSLHGTDIAQGVGRLRVTTPVSESPVAGEALAPLGWGLTKPAMNREIEGYTSVVSARPGDRVALRVSTGARRFHVEAYRFGWYRNGRQARLIWRSDPVRGRRQAAAVFAPYETRTIVAPWRRSLVLPTRGWPEGAYVLKLIASSGFQAHVPFFVRSASSRGKVALVAPVTTWQAYNDWGGYSLYKGRSGDRRAWAVSFDRPYPAPGAGEMMYGVRPVVVRAERLGIPLAYMTNVDLAARRRILRGARGYVSMGHDEYWTLPMRRRVLRARGHGTNLAFLGANTMYWRIRLEDRNSRPRRVVVGYRSDAHLDPMRYIRPAYTTARFRDRPVPRPENSLIGMQYECFPVDVPYRVMTPRWWGFAGTRVRRGSHFANLVGIEADRVYPIASTPRPLQILSHARYSCRGVGTSAQSVYYTSSSGAGVFAAGTLRWTGALGGMCGNGCTLSPRTVRFVRRVTANLLREFAKGRVGRRYPARDNVAEFNLPRTNQVPAS
ncbi:MAG TPA: N,N-dimethylformamidase beta subunit family domain-containing protein [Nocardioidaceae bacterium]